MEENKKISLQKFPYTDSQLQGELYKINKISRTDEELQSLYRKIMGCIDLTTLEGFDTEEKVKSICRQAIELKNEEQAIPSPAAVCVYSPFVALAKEELKNSDIHVASVAGGFPSGQLPIELKIAEVEYAVKNGADEIDMVISRGKLLEGKSQEVYNEIFAIRKACLHQKLKVILETGDLKTTQNIFKAAQIALYAGADYIKTSTGKINVNATPEAFWAMTSAAKIYFTKTGRLAGIKAAGGISTPEDAVRYATIWTHLWGTDKYLDPKYFRIGASRLVSNLVSKIQ